MRAARGDAPRDRLLDFLRDDLPRGEVERIVGQQIKIVVVQPDGIEMVTQRQARRKLLPQLFVHRRQRGFPPRQAELGADFAQKIVLGHQLLFQQRADGRGLLGQAGVNGLGNRRLVAKTRFHGQIFQHRAGHLGIILCRESYSQLFPYRSDSEPRYSSASDGTILAQCHAHAANFTIIT